MNHYYYYLIYSFSLFLFQVLCAVKRLWCFNKNRRVETAGTTNHHSSSSHGLPSLGDSTLNHTTVTSNSKGIPLEPTNC